MQSAICSGKAVSSLLLSVMCLMAFPAKQCIIYVSSMALCRLSAGMKMCNFPWAEIISSAPTLLRLLFSNIPALTFCHKLCIDGFHRERTRTKTNLIKYLCACVSHPSNFKLREQLMGAGCSVSSV